MIFFKDMILFCYFLRLFFIYFQFLAIITKKMVFTCLFGDSVLKCDLVTVFCCFFLLFFILEVSFGASIFFSFLFALLL